VCCFWYIKPPKKGCSYLTKQSNSTITVYTLGQHLQPYSKQEGLITFLWHLSTTSSKTMRSQYLMIKWWWIRKNTQCATNSICERGLSTGALSYLTADLVLNIVDWLDRGLHPNPAALDEEIDRKIIGPESIVFYNNNTNNVLLD